MDLLHRLGSRIFKFRPRNYKAQQWEPDRVTKEEMVTLFARELQRYSKIES
jgi:hypothetical protein